MKFEKKDYPKKNIQLLSVHVFKDRNGMSPFYCNYVWEENGTPMESMTHGDTGKQCLQRMHRYMKDRYGRSLPDDYSFLDIRKSKSVRLPKPNEGERFTKGG